MSAVHERHKAPLDDKFEHQLGDEQPEAEAHAGHDPQRMHSADTDSSAGRKAPSGWWVAGQILAVQVAWFTVVGGALWLLFG